MDAEARTMYARRAAAKRTLATDQDVVYKTTKLEARRRTEM